MDTNDKRGVRWYEVIYVVILVGLLGWSVFIMNPHKVAVVDMDRVFKDVGALQKIEKERQKMEVFTKANNMLQAYKTRIKTLQDKALAASTQAEKEKIAAQMKASEEQFSMSIGPLQSALQQFDAGAVASFRKRIQPYVDKVAVKKGVDVVLAPGPQMLWFKNRVDLTADVTEAAKEFFAKDMPVIDPSVSNANMRR